MLKVERYPHRAHHDAHWCSNSSRVRKSLFMWSDCTFSRRIACGKFISMKLDVMPPLYPFTRTNFQSGALTGVVGRTLHPVGRPIGPIAGTRFHPNQTPKTQEVTRHTGIMSDNGKRNGNDSNRNMHHRRIKRMIDALRAELTVQGIVGQGTTTDFARGSCQPG